MKILDIYEKFHIDIPLRNHQLSVAAICLYLNEKAALETNISNNIVSAALLHDIGNMVKGKSDKFIEGKDFEKWKKIEIDLRNQFGNDADTATSKMIDTLNLVNSEEIRKYIDLVGVKNLISKPKKFYSEINNIILPYADLRIAPSGIVSVETRLDEARRRNPFIEKNFGEINIVTQKLEHLIHIATGVNQIDINLDTIHSHLEIVSNYNLSQATNL